MQKMTNKQWAVYIVSFMVGNLGYRYFMDTDSRSPASYESTDLAQLTAEQNQKLPMRIDQATTLKKTEFVNGKLTYYYIVTLNKETFDRARPVVAAQIEKSICADKFTGMVLTKKKHPIVYSYTDFAGNFLGQHEVAPEFCLR